MITTKDKISLAAMSMKEEFAADDFYHICEEDGVDRSCVSKALKSLRESGKIKACGKRMPCKPPSRKVVVYRVVPSATYIAKSVNSDAIKFHPNDHWWKKVANHPVMLAMNNLDSAISNWSG